MKKQAYKKPLAEAVEIEPQAMMAASPDVAESGQTIQISTPQTDGNAGNSAAKGSDIWDFDEE